MARSLRLEFSGALYHVTSRGVARMIVFRDGRDFQERMHRLHRAVETHGLCLHAFTLMPNHDHLFVETPRANLSATMKDLNAGYAAYFNRRHRRVGHVFQGRFKAHVIENEGHYLEVSRYIHLNPVRADLVTRPEAWPFGSYRGYLDPTRRLDWVTYRRVLASFGAIEANSREAYREFVERGMAGHPSAPWARAEAGLVIGTSMFVERVRRLVSARPDDRALPQQRALRDRPSLESVVNAVSDELGCDIASWPPGTRDGSLVRALAAWFARRRFGYCSREIASRLGYLGPSGVSQSVRRVDCDFARFEIAIARIEETLSGAGASLDTY